MGYQRKRLWTDSEVLLLMPTTSSLILGLALKQKSLKEKNAKAFNSSSIFSRWRLFYQFFPFQEKLPLLTVCYSLISMLDIGKRSAGKKMQL